VNTVKIKSSRGAKKASNEASRRAPGQAAKRAKRAAYHHGDLRQQLLAVTEEIILESGVDGFTLREAARRAGVSPAAPAHHFKDARGLLTAMAILGFREFGEALAKADEAGGTDPARRLHEQGLAYVRFALEHPARFQLMFRDEKLDTTNEEFAAVAKSAYDVLESAVRAATGTPPQAQLSESGHGFLLANWSIVHGFAHLALGHQFRDAQGRPISVDTLVQSLLPLMLQHLPQVRG
jgi:AcrR family transcriptional regulator